jgi:hypothetical protein
VLQKKSERLLLRVTEDMAQQVRSLADVSERTITGQLRALIKTGLEHEAGKCSKVIGAKKSQLLSTGGKREKESAA